MRRGEWDVQKERSLRGANEADGVFRNQICQIALAFYRSIVLVQHRLATRLVVMEVIDRAAERTECRIETMLQREKFRLVTEMPFTTDGRGVAGVLQTASQHAA